MRLVGKIDNELHASSFRDFLYNRGIECEIESAADGAWSIWVHDEDKIGEVGGLFQSFKLNPEDSGFAAEADAGSAKRKNDEKQRDRDHRALKKREASSLARSFNLGAVTVALMALSVLVTILLNTPYKDGVFRWLAMHLPLVETGQVWRLITPIFMHFGILHIVFNMLWLKDLGGMIESIKGSVFMAFFVAVTATVSNLAEFYLSGPGFGGMSGVVYAMLGYVWLQSRLNPWSGFEMHSFTMQMMLVWFVLGLTGVLGGIANGTHAAGLVAGLLWGYLDARRRVA